MPPAGFEPTIPAKMPLQTHPLDCAATEIGFFYLNCPNDYRLTLMSPKFPNQTHFLITYLRQSVQKTCSLIIIVKYHTKRDLLMHMLVGLDTVVYLCDYD